MSFVDWRVELTVRPDLRRIIGTGAPLDLILERNHALTTWDQALKGGVTVVQVREKVADTREVGRRQPPKRRLVY